MCIRDRYYTAFGNRYDEEHFACTICKEPCGVKKCFMFEDQLYCKYHFLKYFSKRCKGCQYPISDQYIEFPEGNDVHCWHPECYGIHKYWHVDLSPETLGLSPLPQLEYNKSIKDDKTIQTNNNMEKQMQAFTFLLTKTWSTLYRFEEEQAACISDMLQYLTSHDQMKGIEATALFVLKVGCLFKAIDSLEEVSIPSSSSFIEDKSQNDNPSAESIPATRLRTLKSKYSKFPRNLSTKIMIYLQLLRKLSAESQTKDVSLSSFMSVITGLAHFLKLLTRYALYTAFEINRENHSVTALVKFLKEIEKNELIKTQPFSYIHVSVTATDSCSSCGKYIQKECVQFNGKRWHLNCLVCSNCKAQISRQDLDETTYNKETGKVLCGNCSIGDPNSLPGFTFVTELQQLIFLLKIALVRSKAMMQIQMKNQINRNRMDHFQENVSMQQTYIRTLNDIKRLKSRKESVKLAHNKQQARRSMVLELSLIHI